MFGHGVFFFFFFVCVFFVFFFKQKTAYEIYQCDWSSDVCSSDLSLTEDAMSVKLTVPLAGLTIWEKPTGRLRIYGKEIKIN